MVGGRGVVRSMGYVVGIGFVVRQGGLRWVRACVWGMGCPVGVTWVSHLEYPPGGGENVWRCPWQRVGLLAGLCEGWY